MTPEPGGRRVATVLTIAGSDSSGGAGIQADLKAIAAHGVHGASVVTAITAQNTVEITLAEAVPAAWVAAQIDAVFADLDVRAVKLGMLGEIDTIRAVARALEAWRPPRVVCDPVMVSKGGHRLLSLDGAAVLRDELFPRVDLVTPNAEEARVLSGGGELVTIADAERAGRQILASGAKAVLVTGGHLSGARGTDVLVTAESTRVFEGRWVESRHTHGTGCTYSAAIATRLALGRSLVDAIADAKEFVTEAIRGGLAVGRGIGPTDPFFFLRGATDGTRGDRGAPGVLHVLTDETIQDRYTHREVARRASEGGADVIQFREKRPWSTGKLVVTARELAAELAGGRARLVVNDRVDVAAAARIDAVHLGAGDLDAGTARRLLGPAAGVGLTAHSLEEAVRAAASRPDYLGVGPVFGTRSKSDALPPLGLDRLEAIVRAVAVPVIAIGSITADRVAEVLATGASGIAVLSAVARGADPERATRQLREAVDSCRAGARA